MTLQMQWPKISIVTPSYNQGCFLETAIDSVLSQGYPNLEYIIMDGGSTDNSLEIIKKYTSHLHFWRSGPDEGHYSAVNEGFAKASGEIFAWLNSDDMYCGDALKTVGTIFAEFPDVAWLTTLRQMVFNSRGQCISKKEMPGFSMQAFLDGLYVTKPFTGLGFIQQESTFWRRELWEEAGGIRTKFSLAGDFDLWARFFSHADLYGVDQPIAGFRVHANNRSRGADTYIHEAEQSLEEMRHRFHWRQRTGISSLCQGFRYASATRRLLDALHIPLPLKNEYSATVISKDSPGMEGRWQMKTVNF